MILVQDEETSDSGAVHRISAIFDKHAIVPADLLGDVGDKRIADLASQTALALGRLEPSQMGEVRVSRNAKHLSADLSELLDVLAKRYELSWADVSEVKWVKQKHNPLAFEVVEAHLCELMAFFGILNHRIDHLEARSLSPRDS